MRPLSSKTDPIKRGSRQDLLGEHVAQHSRSKTDPIKRGSRQQLLLSSHDLGSKTDPIKRGSRRAGSFRSSSSFSFKNRPDQKGIKTFVGDTPTDADTFKNRPDQKGIKTPCNARLGARHKVQKQTRSKGDQDLTRAAVSPPTAAFKNRPDQKGIKTGRARRGPAPRRSSKTDPIKRGSRPAARSQLALYGFKNRPDQKGIKTRGVLWQGDTLARFKNRPDQKGIKTSEHLVLVHVDRSKTDPIKRGSRR